MIQAIMLKRMDKEAEKITYQIITKYKEIKISGTELDDEIILFRTLISYLGIPENKIGTESVQGLKKYCTSIENVCYAVGLNSTLMQNTIILRCAQFLAMIDRKLHSNGIPPCSDAKKRMAYAANNMLEEFMRNPIIFK